MLFGDDLAKQVHDAKETNTISQSLGVNRNQKSRNYRPPYRQDNRSSNSRPQRGGYSDYRPETSEPNPAGNFKCTQ